MTEKELFQLIFLLFMILLTVLLILKHRPQGTRVCGTSKQPVHPPRNPPPPIIDNDGWIPVSERLPTRKEYIENDGWFIVSDGCKMYLSYFDILLDENFVNMCFIDGIDRTVIAWHHMPKRYKRGAES